MGDLRSGEFTATPRGECVGDLGGEPDLTDDLLWGPLGGDTTGGFSLGGGGDKLLPGGFPMRGGGESDLLGGDRFGGPRGGDGGSLGGVSLLRGLLGLLLRLGEGLREKRRLSYCLLSLFFSSCCFVNLSNISTLK